MVLLFGVGLLWDGVSLALLVFLFWFELLLVCRCGLVLLVYCECVVVLFVVVLFVGFVWVIVVGVGLSVLVLFVVWWFGLWYCVFVFRYCSVLVYCYGGLVFGGWVFVCFMILIVLLVFWEWFAWRLLGFCV